MKSRYFAYLICSIRIQQHLRVRLCINFDSLLKALVKIFPWDSLRTNWSESWNPVMNTIKCWINDLKAHSFEVKIIIHVLDGVYWYPPELLRSWFKKPSAIQLPYYFKEIISFRDRLDHEKVQTFPPETPWPLSKTVNFIATPQRLLSQNGCQIAPEEMKRFWQPVDLLLQVMNV